MNMPAGGRAYFRAFSLAGPEAHPLPRG